MVAMSERLFTIHHLLFTQKESPALNNAGLSYKAYSISLILERLAELFSGLFFVAASRLNSPRLFRGLLKHRDLVLSSTSPLA